MINKRPIWFILNHCALKRRWACTANSWAGILPYKCIARMRISIYIIIMLMHRCGGYAFLFDPSFRIWSKTAQNICVQNARRLSDKTAVQALTSQELGTVPADSRNGWISDLPRPEMDCWRPTLDDVDRISWGSTLNLIHRLLSCFV